MSQDDVTQIRVGNSLVGIIGLKSVMEDMAEEYEDRSDREVCEEILNLLCKRNYISEKVKEDYAKAFLREFKNFWESPLKMRPLKGFRSRSWDRGVRSVIDLNSSSCRSWLKPRSWPIWNMSGTLKRSGITG